jgi:ABC-type nickel/cobalt efflux system permease component RcnA
MTAFLGTLAQRGFGLGLLLTAFWFGFRHGIDWDHIAAITDITGSQDDRRRAVLFGTLYALGHALVVMALGSLAIIVGENLPPNVDRVMTRVVGATLVLLGVYVIVALIRHGRDFRLRSRWMLIFAGVRKGIRMLRARRAAATERAGSPQPQPGAVATLVVDRSLGDLTDHPDGHPTAEDVPAAAWHHGHHGHPGHHHHHVPEPDDAFMNYGKATAFLVGMIHGIGAETPTQVLIFLAAAGTGGKAVGVLVLATFILGLLSSNTLITVGSALGFLQATKNFRIYATVAIVTAVFSLTIGTIFLLGKTTLLPALFGG